MLNVNLTASVFEDVYVDAWQIVLLFAIVTAILAIAFTITAVIEKRRGIVRVTGTRELTYGAICLAASFALSYVTLFKLPNGGSITLASVLPIALYCYYFGFRKSIVLCFAYMLLQFLQGPYVVSPWSALFDYLLPYLALCLIGIFGYNPQKYKTILKNNKPVFTAHLRILVGFALYFFVRYISHVLAGVLFWSSGIDFMVWQGDLSGWVAIGYSMAYNALFLVPDTLIAMIAAIAVLANKAFNGFMAKSFYAKNNADSRTIND